MKGIFFNYRQTHRLFKNKYFSNADWNCVEQWFVGVQLHAKLLDWNFDNYYDGHTVSDVTILGVRFLKGYTWQSEQIEGEMIPTPGEVEA